MNTLMNTLARQAAIVLSGAALVVPGAFLGNHLAKSDSKQEAHRGDRGLVCATYLGNKAVHGLIPPKCEQTLREDGWLEMQPGKEADLPSNFEMSVIAQAHYTRSEQVKADDPILGTVTGLSAWLILLTGVAYSKNNRAANARHSLQ